MILGVRELKGAKAWKVERFLLFGFLKVSWFLWDELEGAKARTWKSFHYSLSQKYLGFCGVGAGLRVSFWHGGYSFPGEKFMIEVGLDHWNRCPFFSLTDSCDLISNEYLRLEICSFLSWKPIFISKKMMMCCTALSRMIA